MSSWHQNRNRAALTALWQPLPDRYKCVSDRPGQPAGCMILADRVAVEQHAVKSGTVLIPPSGDVEPTH